MECGRMVFTDVHNGSDPGNGLLRHRRRCGSLETCTIRSTTFGMPLFDATV
jgi:hypothetical protein